MSSTLIVILSVIGIFIVLQFSVRLRGILKKGKNAPHVQGKLGQQISKGNKVIAYFYSPSCRACKTQETHWPKVQEKFENIYRLNAAKEKDVAQAFGVMGTPTTVIIENGKIKDYFVGIVSPSKILKSLHLT